MPALLWHIEVGKPSTPPQTLAEDLALHLRYAPYTTCLVQIGERQQAYLASPGCASCHTGRCLATCQTQLLQRTLIAAGVTQGVRVVPHGLAARPYTRLVLALPGVQAQALDQAALAGWHDARLVVDWHAHASDRQASALLAVGADGPDPAAWLRQYGWRPIVLPHAALRWLCAPGVPTALPVRGRTALLPFMLLPAAHDVRPQNQVVRRSQRAVLAYQPVGERTGSTIADSRVPEGGHPARYLPGIATEPASPGSPAVQYREAQATLAAIEAELNQPTQPLRQVKALAVAAPPPLLERAQIQELACRAAQLPALSAGLPGQVGLSVQRLRSAFQLNRPQAQALLEALEQAELLLPAADPRQPWRHPRPLRTQDLDEIRACLSASQATGA